VVAMLEQVALIGGLVAASYNRSPFGVRVTVEVPEEP